MDDGTYDPDNGGAPDEGIAGLDMSIGSIVAPSSSVPDLAPRIDGGRVASFAHVNNSGRDAGDGVDDDDDEVPDLDRDEENARKDRLRRLKESQKPRHYSPADRVLNDDVFRQLIDSNIKDFEEEHAHIDKHYSSIGSRLSFSNVKCSPHAIQVISDAFEDFLMKLLKRAHVFYSARVRSQELLDDLTLKSNTFGPDHRMLINMRICNESEIKRKRERDMIESVQKQREEDAAAEDDGIEEDERQRDAAERVELKKANSKAVTMEEINREREVMARKGGQGLLVKSYAVKALESFASTGLGLELEKMYKDTEIFFKKISEHPLSGQEVSNVHEIQAEIKKNALRRSRLQESEWRALRLDDLVPVMDAEPTLRRKMVTLYGHELVQAKNNSIVQEELKRRRDAANMNEEKEEQWNIIKRLCGAANGSDELTDAEKIRLDGQLTQKFTQHKLVLPAALSFYRQFIEGGGGKVRKVQPAERRNPTITSMLSLKVAVQRLPSGVTRPDVEAFLHRLNVPGLKNCQFDSHGSNAVLEFHMPQFAQDCVMRVDDQRMRASDPETLKVSLHEAARLDPGNILIAERYENDVSIANVNQLCKNIATFKGTCKPLGASHCFAEFVDSGACAAALNKLHAMDTAEVYFRYVSDKELLEFFSAREKEREFALQRMQRPKEGAGGAGAGTGGAASCLQPTISAHSSVSSSSTSNFVSGIFLTVSGVPHDMTVDQLKRCMALRPGCLVHTLKSREFKGDPSSSLRFQELQVQFEDDANAIACQSAMNGRPFMDNRPEYGAVKVNIRKSKNPATVSAVLTNLHQQRSPIPANTSAPAPETPPSSIVSSNSALPSLQNSSDLLTFLVTLNVPMISQEEITKRYMAYPGVSSSRVEIRTDPKTSGIYSVRCLFVDRASAQRCLDDLDGRPFSPHHDVGPVKVYIKQVSKEDMMKAKERLKMQQAQSAPVPQHGATPQQNVQHMAHSHPQAQPVQYGMPPPPQSLNTDRYYMQPALLHPTQSLPQQVVPGHHPQSYPQPMQPHMMPPPVQYAQYYQQPAPAHVQQQQLQYTQIPHQQMHPQAHQYPQAQQFPMQHAPMQHFPAHHYVYQPQHAVVQFAEAASPTAAETQRLDEEEREIQERMNKLQKK